MELALLVWLVSLLSALDVFMFIVTLIVSMTTVLVGCLWVLIPEQHWDKEIRVNCLNYMFLPRTLVLLMFTAWIIPSEKTIQYMAGAYLLQSVYQSDIVNKATPLAEKAILNQLEAWAKDNPDVANLIQNTTEVK